MVNTKRIARRPLHFDTLDEVIAEAERLVAEGTVARGNWTLGQILDHLTRPMHASIDGFEMRLPIPMRWILPLMKRRVLRTGPPAGIKLNGDFAVFVPDDVSDEEGLARLKAAVQRLRENPARHPSPVLGKLTNEEWEQFHCRHAELHLGFVAPAQG